MTPFPDTPLYNSGVVQGKHSDYWADFARCPRNDFNGSWHSGIPDEDLERVARKAYKSFYFRPQPILREVMKVRSPGAILKKGRAALGMLVK